MSKHQAPKGFFYDHLGDLKEDRRNNADRRGKVHKDVAERERRKFFRRKVDRTIYEKEHKAMIEEALEDFAEEHDNH